MTLLVLKFKALIYQLPFLHTQPPPDPSVWVDFSYRLHLWVKLWCQHLKSLKRKRQRDIHHWSLSETRVTVLSPVCWKRRRLPPSLLVFCQAGQEPCLAGCCFWPGAGNQGEKRTGLGNPATQCDLELWCCHLSAKKGIRVTSAHGAATTYSDIAL